MSVDRALVEKRAEEGDRRSSEILDTLRNLTLSLSGIQLAITAISLVVGYLAQPTIGAAIAPLFSLAGLSPGTARAVATGIALALATAAQMVVGEFVPQNAGIARPAEASRRVIVPLRLYTALFQPVIRFLTGSANAVVKLFGITPRNELVAIRSVDELKLLIESSRHKGSLSEEEFLILARAINFEGKSAADALVPRVSIIALEQQTTLADMTRLALESGRSRFPVYTGDIDNIVGIAHIKDTFPYSPEARRNIRVSRIMTDPLFVPEQRPLQSLLAEMRRDRIHMAIVLDEYGGTAGIITLEDLMEEIVGEIEDEYDPTGGRALTGPAGDVPILSGLLHRREVEEACGFPMPEGDFDTLGGFVLDLLGHIPEQGEHASYAGWELRVVEMDGNRVSQVLLVAPSERRAEEEAR